MPAKVQLPGLYWNKRKTCFENCFVIAIRRLECLENRCNTQCELFLPGLVKSENCVPKQEEPISIIFNLKSKNNWQYGLWNAHTAETAQWSDIVTLKLNKTVDSLTGNPFAITINGRFTAATVVSSTVNAVDNTKIDIKIAEPLLSSTIWK